MSVIDETRELYSLILGLFIAKSSERKEIMDRLKKWMHGPYDKLIDDLRILNKICESSKIKNDNKHKKTFYCLTSESSIISWRERNGK